MRCFVETGINTLVFPEIIGEGQGFATVMEKYEVVHSSNYDVFFHLVFVFQKRCWNY